MRDVSPPRRFSRQSRPRYLWKGLGGFILIILVCSEKGNQDMVMTRMTGLAVTYQALSSPTTSTETSSAPAALTSQLHVGRKGERKPLCHGVTRSFLRSDQLPTPRYMDWYTKQQQQQKELLLVHFHISHISSFHCRLKKMSVSI